MSETETVTDREQLFSYRASGKTYWGTTAAFLALILLEGGLAVGMALMLISTPAVKWPVAALLAAVLVGVPLRLLLAPLWTRHRLTADALEIHYGRQRFAVPQSSRHQSRENQNPSRRFRSRHQ